MVFSAFPRLVFTAILLAASLASAGQEKVVYLDLELLLHETKVARQLLSQLEALVAKEDQPIRQKLENRAQLEQILERDGAKMTENQRNEVIAQWEVANREYEEAFALGHEIVEKKRIELLGVILEKAGPFVEKVINEKDISIVITDKNALGYVNQRANITEEVFLLMEDAFEKGTLSGN
jgi:outer membrane protein